MNDLGAVRAAITDRTKMVYLETPTNPLLTLIDLEEVIGIAKSGEWLPFLKANVWTGQKASLFWAIGSGRYFQTAGLFILGLWLGRKLAQSGWIIL